MNFKKFIITIVLIFISCENNNNTVKVFGNIKGLKKSTLKLLKLDLESNEPIVIDSFFSMSGNFNFTLNKAPSYLYTLAINDTLKIPFFSDTSDTEIKGDLSSLSSFEVESLSKEDIFFRTFSQDDFFEKEKGMEIMLKNPDKIVSVFTAYYQFQIFNISKDTMDIIMNKYSDYSKQSTYFDYLNKLYERITNIKEGKIAPNFSAKTKEGELISLIDYRGKYVLLDFWASWCAPCIQKFPEMKNIYDDSDNDEFEILGVSVDMNRDSWVNSILKNKLNWINISNARGWDEISDRYGVKAVPQNFLINPDGIIIKKNIDIKELKLFVNSL
jgi:peroxiredoxin